eukprot:TRINITY_DN15358_c0_g1_i1.p1 TRINITY_DN15358_c0_g1~~TRINITY_DN15358_c0_g1_i1.p1  ORF type:complete len:1055 (-),score=204.53 TRINITY_DN15358_c0_g1_i1:47-3211(-)
MDHLAEPAMAAFPKTPTTRNIALVKEAFTEVIHADEFMCRQVLLLALSRIMPPGTELVGFLDQVPQDNAPDGKISVDAFLCFVFRGHNCGTLPPPEPKEIESADLENNLGHDLRFRLDVSTSGRDTQGKPALILAAQSGDLDRIRLLAQSHADLEARDEDGRTAVIHATISGHSKALALLAEFKANLEAKEAQRNSTPVIFAACHGRKDCLLFLVKSGVDLEAEMTKSTSPHGVLVDERSTATSMAAANGHLDCLRILADNGADINAKRENGRTPAMLAAHEGHKCCLSFLAERRADLAAMDRKNRTAAMHAAFGGNRDCLYILAQHVADMGAVDNSDLTPSVAMAFLLGTSDLLFGDDLASVREGQATTSTTGNTRNSAWPPPPTTDGEAEARLGLLTAASNGDESELRRLLASGVTPAARTSGVGRTAAMLACRNDHAGCLRAILQYGGNPDWRDRRGVTAVITAARFGSEGCLRVLMEWDGTFDTELRDNYGHTALNSAARCGHAGCVRLLLEACSNVDAEENRGLTPAIQAAGGNHHECLDLLIKGRADLSQRTDTRGVTALGSAAAKGHERCIRVLIDNGADLLEKDGSGVRPVERITHTNPGLLLCVLPRIDWLAAAEKGPDGIRASLLPQNDISVHALEWGIPGSSPWANLSLASLHSAIWSGPGVRGEGSELARKLADQTREFITRAGDQRIDERDKQLTKVLLSLGVLAADDLGRLATESAVEKALAQLFEACEKRQAELGLVAESTSQVDTVFPHANFQGEVTKKLLNQRDVMPENTWRWLAKPRLDCFEGLYSAFDAFRTAGAVTTTNEFAEFLQARSLTNDVKLFAVGAVDLLESYAKLVNDQFVMFMREHFGEAFKAAPVKRKPRILEKVKTELLQSIPRFPGFDSVEGLKESADDARIRNSFFTLGDFVRGSIVADGAEAMLAVLEKLKAFGATSQDISISGPTFDVWRVKNTHHPDAITVGGYRDVKVLGPFRAPADSAQSMCKTWPASALSQRSHPRCLSALPLSMIVEVQIIDAQFLNIKKFMHKVYAVKRGDYWEH